MENYIEQLKEIAIKAGDITMSYYKKNPRISIKADNSLLTDADIASHNYISSSLYELNKDITIISEEKQNNSLAQRRFWLVDPLDGTQGFVNQNDQFSINIALIEQERPVLGLIYLPVEKILYYNVANKAYKQHDNEIIAIKVSNNNKNMIVASSLYDTCSQTKEFIDRVRPSKILNISSAIKFCLIAEGKVDLYPRFNCTMEWDVAAGEAIINAAGGRITNTLGGALIYGKESFKNNGFIAYGY
jgi:3'(2'), 5'-bisphosphate nucleotidase